MNRFNFMALYTHFFLVDTANIQVNYLATLSAKKMMMRMQHVFVAYFGLGNGQNVNERLATKDVERVINRRFRQGWHLFIQCAIDHIYGGMRTVLVEIFENFDPLERWFNSSLD